MADIDRCTTDAIQVITGVSIGRRTLKHVNYGKFAATFVDTTGNKVVRVRLLPKWPKKILDMQDFSQFVCNASDEELFTVQEGKVTIQPEDMPGFPIKKSDCSRCGEEILDGKEIIIEEKSVCQNCAYTSYFTIIATDSCFT
ncbi:MAG: formylmethanofuran dehydrogenase [Methanomicrobiales archaeon HGW-Methanomicrobiales-4]|nr:MAG: formylmethanofuran dehydrogenase [Methanomicrobiales archaeon HGW-Methanomicrobiales-4]